MRFALVGQPNCGKSTLFNQVAGYRAETGNFAGTTVTFTESKVRVLGDVVDIVDLPGAYTLAGASPAEREAFRYLASREVDAIINVVDASHLAHGLSLTLELLELQRPIVIALNMMDEALRLGMRIEGPALEQALGAPVLPVVASRGRGVKELFTKAYAVARSGAAPRRPMYAPDIEAAIQTLLTRLQPEPPGNSSAHGNTHASGRHPLKPEAIAIKLLELDNDVVARVEQAIPGARALVKATVEQLEHSRGQTTAWLMSAERQRRAQELAHSIVKQGARRFSWRDRLDDILLHPILGYVGFVVIMLTFFQIIYGIGSVLEKPVLALFEQIAGNVPDLLGADNLSAELATGLLQGISGGVAIVLPYLAPFLLGLGILEDVGYLPRVAFLMDALMHRLGLHGKAIVPFILGYGCNIPAVMSTRILEEPKDRFLAAALSTMVPCAARLAVVFGLVAFYLGPALALVIYVFNLFVIAVTGRVLSRFLPEDSPGLILEMPVYRAPTARAVTQKAWFRIREFIVEAWPILIAGSVALALLNYLEWTRYLNMLVWPITWALGLPGEVGTPLLFGILRKELSLVMLAQALGSSDFGSALTSNQMITFTVFVVFYVPCLGTLAVLMRELGRRHTAYIVALTIGVALAAALVARVFSALIV